jgi:TATA-binding protein-associated factor
MYNRFVQDLASMGRLVGVDFFFSQKAFDEEKADMKELRRVKAASGEDCDPLNVEEDEDGSTREIQAAIALRMQGQFEQRVLRRTKDSKNWLGENLIVLPQLHEHTVLLRLRAFEQEIHSKLAERLRDE